MRRFCVAAVLGVLPSLAAAQADPAFRALNQPVAPFKIAANVYYVGASDLTSYLFTSPAGHILLDAGVVETAPQILANIKTLGFDPRDVKILIASHAHFDHAGGFAALKAATGAKLFATAPDAKQLAAGGRNTWDGFSAARNFPEVTADSAIADGSIVQLGGTKLVAHLTPGHTKGCTTWTTTIESGGKPVDATFLCSMSVPGYKIVGNAGYPAMIADYERTFGIIKTLKCDFFFGPHGSFFDFTAKAAKLRGAPNTRPNPFIDPAGCRRYIDDTERAFHAQVASEMKSPAGQWSGVVTPAGSAPLRILINLDSAQGAWTGSLVVSQQTSQPIPFASATRSGDSLTLRLPETAQGAVFRLRFSSDGSHLDGSIAQGSTGGPVTTARTGSPEAAKLAAGGARLDESRRLADLLAKSTPKPKPPTANPDSALLVTSDIALFWKAIERALADSLGDYLQRGYLDQASVGVRDFIPGRIMSAEDLASYVRSHRAAYDSLHAGNADITRADPAIRAAFRKLKALYPPAVFPDVYFVIGRHNSGGTSTDHGLLIGAEMYPDPMALPPIVSHELIHFQQHGPNGTLLEQSFNEGAADFLGEMISGAQINSAKQQYGLAHEAELWKEFSARFDDKNTSPWLYGPAPGGRPNDLGYFIGYRIAQAYYNRATDKRQAIRDIITMRDGKVRELLTVSGYDPK